MNEKKTMVIRLWILILFACGIITLYLLRMVSLQLVHGEEYQKNAVNTRDYSFTVTAARGDIVDSYGRRIATSTVCHNVELNKVLMGDQNLNETLEILVGILRANGESWNDPLPVSRPDRNGRYTFTTDPDSESEQKQLDNIKEELGLQQYATADEVMEKIVETFALGGYTKEWQRILGGIRYRMKQEAFSNVNNFTLAENVSDKTVATVKERSLTLHGVDIVETTTRSYPDGTILPHILGRVGQITAERWKVVDSEGHVSYPLKEKNYSMNDTIGISGLEAAFEDELRGKSGKKTITRDSDGAVIATTVTEEPQPGKTLMLTVDSEFQKAVDEALERNIQKIAQNYGSNGVAANAGAVVVVDVKTGGILAASNYPSFDQNLYNAQYSEYSSDPALPLYNRALQGLYTPGSTFKPCVALAALLSGTITKTETVYCSGVYTYFPDYHPRCTRHGHSGSIAVVEAIKWSCNIFFYDVGRRVGSETYDDYARRLGMGVKTGVEVGESSGRLTTKEDANYTPSLEIQAAIGQGNTVVTPLQLATYAATIANKGVRYKTHFVQALLDSNTGEVLQRIDPEVEEVIEDNTGAFDTVEKGMIGVSRTVAGLSDYPYTIACKTGTPQRSETYFLNGVRKHYDNTMMIAYGPVEDPQIAIGIAIEYGGGGARAGYLVADIFDAYFFEKKDTLSPVKEGTLLE